MSTSPSPKHLKRKKEDTDEESDSSSYSSSSSEDEEGEAVTEQKEKDWLWTLAALKNKDPRIYDKSIKFYQSSDEETEVKKPKVKKEKPVSLQDVQRKTLIETDGAPPPDAKILYEDEEEEQHIPVAPSYYEEQDELKKKFLEAAPSSDDEDLLLKKDSCDKKKDEDNEEEYRLFLKGKKKKLKRDKKLAPELSILKNYWSKPDLDEGEQFLRDYILNKGYKDQDKDKIPSYEAIVGNEDSIDDDVKILQKQEDFEREYNFRFQEPDKNFIKSYPRKIKDSVRPEDSTRIEKRKKILERKKKEMEKKQEELKQIKKKKRKQIMDKIAELKEMTGNSSLGILDLDGEFDAKKHDEMMQAMFSNYEENGNEKPVFSDDDWDETYYDDDAAGHQAGYENDGEMPGCSYDVQEELDIEDPNFNMDADYDPSQSQRTKKERKRNKKSKKVKPVFNADEMTFDEYFDEYYKLDYEDLIDDQPCRYQYRSVLANDFGLSADEILNTDDKELNSWCPLRKMLQYRTEQEEFDDEMMYYKRGKNIKRKKKFLSSFYNQKEDSVNEEIDKDVYQNGSKEYSNLKKETSKKNKKKKHFVEEKEEWEEEVDYLEEEEEMMEVRDSVDVVPMRESVNGLSGKAERKGKGQLEKQVVDKEEEEEGKEDKTLLESSRKKKRKKKKKNLKAKESKESEQVKKEKVNETPTQNLQKKRKREEESDNAADEVIGQKSTNDENHLRNSNAKDGKKQHKKQKMKHKLEGTVPKTAEVTNSSMSEQEKSEVNADEGSKASAKDKNGKGKREKQHKKQKIKNKSDDSAPKTPEYKKSSISNTRIKKKNRAEMWRKKNDGDSKRNEDLNISLSNARLKAYGLNPKKFKYLKITDKKS